MREQGSSSDARPVFDAGRVERVVSVFLALGTGTVLGIAAWLEPASAGHGTHMQLGLGNCSFLGWTGQPCPMCGATTTFALMASGQPITAIINQPFASLLFVMTVGVLGVSVAEALQPRRRWTRFADWVEPYEGWLAVAFLALMGTSWIYKAAMMGAWFDAV